MVFCGSCGHQNDDNAKFCEGCGEALEFEAVEIVEELPDEKVELDIGEDVIEEVQEPIEEVIEEQVETLQIEEVADEVIVDDTIIEEKQPVVEKTQDRRSSGPQNQEKRRNKVQGRWTSKVGKFKGSARIDCASASPRKLFRMGLVRISR